MGLLHSVPREWLGPLPFGSERELALMDGATATKGKALRVFQRTGKLWIATRLNFKFCSDEQDPEVAGTRARNAQWIRPNRRLGAAPAGVAAN